MKTRNVIIRVWKPNDNKVFLKKIVFLLSFSWDASAWVMSFLNHAVKPCKSRCMDHEVTDSFLDHVVKNVNCGEIAWVVK